MLGQIELEDWLRSLEKRSIEILDYIPIGRNNAITRTKLCLLTGLPDRNIRLRIHLARREMPILNMQDGKGYFIPDMNDMEDVRLLTHYVRQEESRLKQIGWSLMGARKTLRNCGIDWREESKKKGNIA